MAGKKVISDNSTDADSVAYGPEPPSNVSNFTSDFIKGSRNANSDYSIASEKNAKDAGRRSLFSNYARRVIQHQLGPQRKISNEADTKYNKKYRHRRDIDKFLHSSKKSDSFAERCRRKSTDYKQIRYRQNFSAIDKEFQTGRTSSESTETSSPDSKEFRKTSTGSTTIPHLEKRMQSNRNQKFRKQIYYQETFSAIDRDLQTERTSSESTETIGSDSETLRRKSTNYSTLDFKRHIKGNRNHKFRKETKCRENFRAIKTERSSSESSPDSENIWKSKWQRNFAMGEKQRKEIKGESAGKYSIDKERKTFELARRNPRKYIQSTPRAFQKEGFQRKISQKRHASVFTEDRRKKPKGPSFKTYIEERTKKIYNQNVEKDDKFRKKYSRESDTKYSFSDNLTQSRESGTNSEESVGGKSNTFSPNLRKVSICYKEKLQKEQKISEAASREPSVDFSLELLKIMNNVCGITKLEIDRSIKYLSQFKSYDYSLFSIEDSQTLKIKPSVYENQSKENEEDVMHPNPTPQAELSCEIIEVDGSIDKNSTYQIQKNNENIAHRMPTPQTELSCEIIEIDCTIDKNGTYQIKKITQPTPTSQAELSREIIDVDNTIVKNSTYQIKKNKNITNPMQTQQAELSCEIIEIDCTVDKNDTYQIKKNTHPMQNQQAELSCKESITNYFAIGILQWDPNWLNNDSGTNCLSPIFNSYSSAKSSYESIMNYYDTFAPLNLLSIWLNMLKNWQEQKCAMLYCVVEFVEEDSTIVKITCSAELYLPIVVPRQEDIILGKFENGEAFFRVRHVTEEIQTSKIKMDLECLPNFKVAVGDAAFFYVLLNIRMSLLQNNALRSINSDIRDLVLNPKSQKDRIELLKLNPEMHVKHQVDEIFNIFTAKQPQVTLIDSSICSNLLMLIVQLATCLIGNTGGKIVICFKNEKSFQDIVKYFVKFDPVLAVCTKDITVSAEFEKFTLKHRILQAGSSVLEIINRCDLFITSFSAFNTKVLSELRNITCILDEAHNCSEAESALALALDIQRLVLIGRPTGIRNMNQILKRYGFNVSLFYRLLKTKLE